MIDKANIFVGDYVLVHGKDLGRVTKVHSYECPESDAWLACQRLIGPNPMRFKNARWISVLLHRESPIQAGAVVVPDRPEFIQVTEPFDLVHRDADLYFRENA